MPFKKGQSGNPAGKPKGTLNKATAEVRGWLEKLMTSKKYRESAERRIVAGKAPHLEGYALQLIGGKPTEHVEVSGEGGGPVTVIYKLRPQDAHPGN